MTVVQDLIFTVRRLWRDLKAAREASRYDRMVDRHNAEANRHQQKYGEDSSPYHQP